MDEIGQRLDEVSRAVTRDRALAGLADVRRRASRHRRATRTGAALVSVVVLAGSALALEVLGDPVPTTVTTNVATPPPPTAQPSESPDASPSPAVRDVPHRPVRSGELPRATVRDADTANTWRQLDEGQQFGFPTRVATYGAGVRPRQVTPSALEVAFGAVWVPATDGVVRIDPTTLQPTDFVPTGPVLALASSGYASMYAVVETEGRGLGVATWEGSAPGRLRIAVLDATPGSADGVSGHQVATGFGEVLHLTRTHPDRPAELLEISPANGTYEVTQRFGAPGTRLVVDRIDSDSERDLWVGGSDGILRHVHTDGRVTTVQLDGPVLDVDVADPTSVWLTVGVEGGSPRPVRVDAATERVTADLTGIAARYVTVEVDGERVTVWTSSGTDELGGVQIALVVGQSGQALTTASATVGAAHRLTIGPDGDAFAIATGTGEVLRFSAEFGE